METIPHDQKHSAETFLYAASRMLERAGYYGIRSILIMWMVRGPLQMSDSDSSSVYGWFVWGLIITQGLGAVIGDLMLGTKRAVIVGGLLQASGALVLCLETIPALYTGMGLMMLGAGLYSPNMLAMFGKAYLAKLRLLDGGFSINYTVVSIGALLAPFLFSLFGFPIYFFGFIMGAVLMILSVFLFLLAKQKDLPYECFGWFRIWYHIRHINWHKQMHCIYRDGYGRRWKLILVWCFVWVPVLFGRFIT